MAAFLEEALQRAKNRAKAAAAKVEDLIESHSNPTETPIASEYSLIT